MMKSNQQIADENLKIKKKIITPTKRGKTSPQNFKKNEETVFSILTSLSDKEKNLLSEKNQLLDVEESLKKRIIKEIEAKKTNILDLQTEIPKVKKRIEDLAKILEIPVVK